MGSAGSMLARKGLHVAMGGFAVLLAWLSWPQAALLAAVALLHNLFVLPRYGRQRFYRGAARERGHDVGIVLYPAMVLVLILVFRERLELVAAAWGMLAAGDGFATIVGVLAGRRGGRLPYSPDKSWAGLIAFFVFGAPAAVALYAHVSGLPLASSWVVPVVLATAVIAIVESLPLGINDNIIVPIGGGALLYALLLIEPGQLAANGPLFLERLPWALGVNLVLGVVAWRLRSVDVSGLVHGTLLGTGLWVLGGWPAFLMLLVFFVLGTGATKLGYRIKAAEGTAQEKGGARGAAHAWANTGAGLLFALLAAGSADPGPFLLAIAAAFATAASDTLGSEVGQAYGRRTFLITSFRPVPRGTDGAVSLEGTLAGIVGSAFVGAIAWASGMVGPWGIAFIVVAAFVGTTLESYLGALFERAQQMSNEAQNFLNTLVGGLVAILVAWTLA